MRRYSLDELEEMCPKGIRLFVRLKKLKYGYRNPTGFRRWDCDSPISKAVEEYIDYYNNKRIQAKTKWMPPVQYRIASMRSA